MESRVVYVWVAGVACLFPGLMVVTPIIPQPQSYHDFADRRQFFGERWGWTSFYVGMTAVAFGSSYYHLKPNDDRLVWDRLPMTVGAVSVLAIFIIERVDEKKGTMSIITLNMAGIFSVVYWRVGEATGRMTFKLTPLGKGK